MTTTARITDSNVRHILLSDSSNREIARELGISHQLVSMIRLGHRFSHMATDIPRWEPQSRDRSNDATCFRCIHYSPHVDGKGRPRPGCSLDFPEASKTSGKFARLCSCYTEGTE